MRAAIRSGGFDFPMGDRRITVNLAPADARKERISAIVITADRSIVITEIGGS